jgi:hypothetical protein
LVGAVGHELKIEDDGKAGLFGQHAQAAGRIEHLHYDL